MKRLIFTLIVLALMATPTLANFTFTTADVLSFGEISDYTHDDFGDPANFEGAYTDDTLYGGDLPLQSGYVGLVAHAVGRDTTQGGTINYIGLGLSSFDLSANDTLVVTISNDNNTGWKYKLFADDGSLAGTTYATAWSALIASGGSVTLSLPYSGLDLTSRIGVMIGSDERQNTLHSSILIPAPGAIILGSLGVGLVGWLRRRKTL